MKKFIPHRQAYAVAEQIASIAIGIIVYLIAKYLSLAGALGFFAYLMIYNHTPKQR